MVLHGYLADKKHTPPRTLQLRWCTDLDEQLVLTFDDLHALRVQHFMSKRCVYEVLSFAREAQHNSIKTATFHIIRAQSGCKTFEGHYESEILYSVLTQIPAST